MKMVYPEIQKVFDTDIDSVNSIIIEEQSLMFDICMDIYNQTQGHEGKTIVSVDDKPLDISKNVELLVQFIPFELNKKNLINKLITRAENLANEPEYYENTMTEMANLEKYLWEITDFLEGNIIFSKLSVSNLFKMVGMEFEDDYKSIGEKVIDYMELVREYDRNKLFILVNIRSFIDDMEFEKLLDTILRKQLDVIIFENCEKAICVNEHRFIVDNDLCEIV